MASGLRFQAHGSGQGTIQKADLFVNSIKRATTAGFMSPVSR